MNNKERSGQSKKFENGGIISRIFMSDAQRVIGYIKYR